MTNSITTPLVCRVPGEQRQIFFHRRQVVNCCRLDVQLRVGSSLWFHRRPEQPPTNQHQAAAAGGDDLPASQGAAAKEPPSLVRSQERERSAEESAVAASDGRKGPEAMSVYVDIDSDQGTMFMYSVCVYYRYEVPV